MIHPALLPSEVAFAIRDQMREEGRWPYPLDYSCEVTTSIRNAETLNVEVLVNMAGGAVQSRLTGHVDALSVLMRLPGDTTPEMLIVEKGCC